MKAVYLEVEGGMAYIVGFDRKQSMLLPTLTSLIWAQLKPDAYFPILEAL